MEKFSIDVKASGKKEMKEARKFLRDNGKSVIKRKNELYSKSSMLYLSNSKVYDESDYDFEYYNYQDKIILLTLPQDWNRFVSLVLDEGCYFQGISSLANNAFNPTFKSAGITKKNVDELLDLTQEKEKLYNLQLNVVELCRLNDALETTPGLGKISKSILNKVKLLLS